MAKYSDLLVTDDWMIFRHKKCQSDNFICVDCKKNGLNEVFVPSDGISAYSEVFVKIINKNFLNSLNFNYLDSSINETYLHLLLIKKQIIGRVKTGGTRFHDLIIFNPENTSLFKIIENQVNSNNYIEKSFDYKFYKLNLFKINELYLNGYFTTVSDGIQEQNDYNLTFSFQNELYKDQLVYIVPLFDNKLNVHHRRYYLNRNPWEYSNNDLKTVCADCHTKIHIKEKVAVYYDNKELSNINWCAECSGTGFKPQYSYYYDGICFDCDGLGFKNNNAS